MTDLDDKLVRSLRIDGRAQFSALAKSLGVNRALVAARVNHLLESGEVRVVAGVHPRVLGLGALAHLAIRIARDPEPVYGAIGGLDGVAFLSETTGPYQAVAELRLPTMEELADVTARIRALPQVTEVNILLYEHIIRTLFLGEEPPVPDIELDETDIAIMTQLQRDGRLGFGELGKMVELSTSACRTRVLRLIDANVMHIGAIRRRPETSTQIVFGVGITVRTEARDVVEVLTGLPELEFVARTIGRYAYVATVVADSIHDYNTIVRGLRALASVETVETWIHAEVRQELYERDLDRLAARRTEAPLRSGHRSTRPPAPVAETVSGRSDDGEHKGMTQNTPSRFGLVGTGWRADFFLRLAAALPDRFEVAAVATRDPAKGAVVEKAWSVPTVRNASDLIGSYQPDFVVASVNRVATPQVIETCVRQGTPVLAETPPALDLAAMRELWQRLSRPELVQVAEQYPYLPKLQAFRALIAAGRLGDVTAAEVSWTQGYHAVAMLRGLLGAEFREVTVMAQALTVPISASLGRDGWPDSASLTDVTRTTALLNFGDRLGVYDFTDGQWFHPLMGRRLTVRGTTGEIIGDRVTTLLDHRTPVTATLQRRQTGIDGDLEGFDLDTISLGSDVLYRNPFQGIRLSDEDIAIATVLDRMSGWVRGTAEPPYPLAQACQDHLLALAIAEAAKGSRPVTVSREAWAKP